MSANEQELVREGEFKTYSEVVERIAEKTIPGSDNSELVESVGGLPDVLEEIIDDLNNWVEIVDVRVFRGKVIGIPMRYRWTIKRWANSDMDRWLLDNDWDNIAHLKADSRKHEDNEMEARYYKEFGEWDVFVNIYVEFTEDVFNALEENSVNTIERERSGEVDRDEHLDAVKRMKRSE